jgi:hypothetical protein
MSLFSRVLNFDPRKTRYYKTTEKIITPRLMIFINIYINRLLVDTNLKY